MEKVVCNSFVLVLLLFSINVKGQINTPPLERVVNVSFNGESSQQALLKLETAGNFTFAYRTNLVPDNDNLNRIYLDKTVREVLDDMFQSQLSYKQKGNYILLKSAQVLKKEEVHISGYVFDLETGGKIAYASIYDSVTLISTLSDLYGYYSIELEKVEKIKLDIKKEGYYDTTILWNGKENAIMDIALRKIIVHSEEDSISNERFKFLKLTPEQKATIKNFKDNLKGKIQFSVLPSIGTNGKLSPVTSVDNSFNLFGGFNQSVRKMELSALTNMNYDSVQYFQAAGLMNLTGGYQRGLQLAGFSNLNNESFKGMQAAGFLSLTKQNFSGFQANGFASITLNEFKGVQTSGFGNFVGNSSKATQIAGGINYAGKNFDGVQVAGLLNYARTISGTQIGVFNYNDSIDGISLGLISFSRKGLHQLELAGEDFTYANVSFRTGNNQFYNIISAGSRFDKSMVWSYGYGIGSSVRAGAAGRVYFDLEASGVMIGKNGKNTAILNQFTINYQFAFSNKLALAFGPTLNFYLTQNGQGESMRDLVPYSFYSASYSNFSQQMWVGGKLALRFF